MALPVSLSTIRQVTSDPSRAMVSITTVTAAARGSRRYALVNSHHQRMIHPAAPTNRSNPSIVHSPLATSENDPLA